MQWYWRETFNRETAISTSSHCKVDKRGLSLQAHIERGMNPIFVLAVATLASVVVARSQSNTTLASPASAAASVSSATPAAPPGAPAKRSAAELQKLAEPIALHPDDLVAVILPASVYPLEIVQAARFVKDTNNISKLDAQPWDDNVKAVARFPQMIAKMDADLPWTIALGEAFVNQSKELMDAIQNLRSMAQKAGNLKTSDQQIVTVTSTVVHQTNLTEVVEVPKEIITIVPSDPAVVYVPSYPPAIYYPWYPYYGYAAPFISFGVGFAWGAFWGAAWNSCNWGGGHVEHHSDINRDVNRNVDRNTDRNRNTDRAQARDRGSSTRGRDGGRTSQWKPDQNRMSQNRGSRGANREARGWGSAQTRSALANSGARSSTGALGGRPSGGNAGSRLSSGAGTRPSAGNVARSGSGTRPSATGRGSSRTYGGRSSSSGRSSAFNRSGGGSSARSSSVRGGSSRGGGGFRGGGRGGGGRGGGGGRR